MSERHTASHREPEQCPLTEVLAAFFSRAVRRGKETHDEKIARYLASVRLETARVPGVVGRLATIVDNLADNPPHGAEVHTSFDDDRQFCYVTQGYFLNYHRDTDVSVAIERSTWYDYHPAFWKLPRGHDELLVRTAPTNESGSQPGLEQNDPGASEKEVGMRIKPDSAEKNWLVHGLYQSEDWGGRLGAQYQWHPLEEATAHQFLDRVFG